MGNTSNCCKRPSRPDMPDTGLSTSADVIVIAAVLINLDADEVEVDNLHRLFQFLEEENWDLAMKMITPEIASEIDEISGMNPLHKVICKFTAAEEEEKVFSYEEEEGVDDDEEEKAKKEADKEVLEKIKADAWAPRICIAMMILECFPESVGQKDRDGNYPIDLAMNSYAPSVFLLHLASLCPAAVSLHQLIKNEKWTYANLFVNKERAASVDENERLPLHSCLLKLQFGRKIALNGKDCSLRLELIKTLVAIYPDGCAERDVSYRTPLAYAYMYHASKSIIACLFQANKNAISLKEVIELENWDLICTITNATNAAERDLNLRLPLHLILIKRDKDYAKIQITDFEWMARMDAIEAIIAAYPEGVCAYFLFFFSPLLSFFFNISFFKIIKSIL